MARISGPSRHGEWIWAAHLTSWNRGVSFYAVRDFDLETVPEEVRLWVQADQEYTFMLNGVRVGSDRYRSGDRLDT